jgi:hypothetical protein
MAALTFIVPTNTGALSAPAAVSASDTIDRSSMGNRGCYLDIINGGGSSDTVAISDAGLSPAGNAAVSGGGPVANGAARTFFISREAANASTNLVTVTHTFTTSVTYKLWAV